MKNINGAATSCLVVTCLMFAFSHFCILVNINIQKSLHPNEI